MTQLRLCVLFMAVACELCAQSDFYLRNGDRVVFYGDSITDQRLYTLFVETYAVTRFPDRQYTFVDSGWGGDRVVGGEGGPIDLRLKRDVLAYKPTVLTIMLGMNDASYRSFDTGVMATYQRGYEHILDVVQGALPKVRVTLIQPSPFDDFTRPVTFEGGYNAVLIMYGNYLKSLAKSMHLDTADFNGPVTAALSRANQTNAADAQKLIPDRVHPGPGIHLVMAGALLKAWHAPATVSTVELNMASHQVSNASNAAVTDWKGMAWTASEKSLPMPINWADPLTTLAMNSSDFVQELDQETLQIDGLATGKWQLKIDDHAVGVFTSDEWKRGVNLARLDTPMTRQAAEVHDLTKLHTNIHNSRWREFEVPLAPHAFPGMHAVLKSLDRLEVEAVQAQHLKAQPLPHRFELVSTP